MIFAGARDHDMPAAPLAHPERLGLALVPCRRRYRYGPVIAAWIAALACAAAAAWIASEVAVAILLDEGRLAAIGVAP